MRWIWLVALAALGACSKGGAPATNAAVNAPAPTNAAAAAPACRPERQAGADLHRRHPGLERGASGDHHRAGVPHRRGGPHLQGGRLHGHRRRHRWQDRQHRHRRRQRRLQLPDRPVLRRRLRPPRAAPRSSPRSATSSGAWAASTAPPACASAATARRPQACYQITYQGSHADNFNGLYAHAVTASAPTALP